MKKSSKSSRRSKNIRHSKKTRKHMRKMRGGKLDLLNQRVDFILYCGNSEDNFEILVSPNSEVANPPKNLALIGTFATDPIVVDDKGANIFHDQYEDITKGIAEVIKSNDQTKLVPLTKENALLFLLKDLKLKGLNITNDIKKLLEKLTPVIIRGYKFRYMFDDIRMSNPKECTTLPIQHCNIKTQLFKIKITEEQKYLFKTDNLKWINFNNDNDEMFSDHKQLIDDALDELFEDSGSGSGSSSGFGYGSSSGSSSGYGSGSGTGSGPISSSGSNSGYGSGSGPISNSDSSSGYGSGPVSSSGSSSGYGSGSGPGSGPVSGSVSSSGSNSGSSSGSNSGKNKNSKPVVDKTASSNSVFDFGSPKNEVNNNMHV